MHLGIPTVRYETMNGRQIYSSISDKCFQTER
jgi:hypothetical protein